MIFEDGRPLRRPYAQRLGDYLWGIFPAACTLLLLLALWQAAHQRWGDLILPAPAAVFQRMAEILGGIESASILQTLWRSALALSAALGVGSILGWICGSSRTLALMARPLMTLLLGMPPIVWLVLALFWLGMGHGSVLFTIWIVVIPLVFSSAQNSLLSVPVPLKEMLQVYAVPWRRRIRYFYLPHILRQMLPALIVAVGSGLKVSVMAELLGSNDGIGSEIARGRAMLDTVSVMAWVLLLVGIIMLIEYGILEPLRRYVLREQP